jgi:hypothetical protein
LICLKISKQKKIANKGEKGKGRTETRERGTPFDDGKKPQKPVTGQQRSPTQRWHGAFSTMKK